ncbi:MAG TPA: FAD-dependent oxidoreductase [Polyangiaceae bacterium]
MPVPPVFDARLVGGRTLSPNVRELTFERADAHPMAFAPGQWLNMMIPVPHRQDEPVLKRSYSIASAPDGSPRFDIAVTRVKGGPGSTWLHEVEPGAVLPFVGPQGFFTRPGEEGAPALMIATGTGVTPIRSMVRAAVAAGSRAPMWILLGVRHEEDMLYRDELDALARDHAHVRFMASLSQPRGDWRGRRGYVQTHVPELWRELATHGAAPPHAWICGLERMVGSVREILRKDMGIARQQVHSERYD